MNRQEEIANHIYKTIQPSVIDETEIRWWHEFAKGKAQDIVNNIIIPSLNYVCQNDADLQAEQVMWRNIIGYIKGIEL